jgi:excisionase family DNA binding protein
VNKEVFSNEGKKMGSDVKFLTIEDVADMLQVTRTTVYNLKKRGLPFIKIGKSIRFNQEDVIEWVMNNSRDPKEEKE